MPYIIYLLKFEKHKTFLKFLQIAFIQRENVLSLSRKMGPFKVSQKAVTGQIRDTNTLLKNIESVRVRIHLIIYLSI